MTTDDEFIRRLVGFGLSEKEAQTYLHLLSYGPKTPSPLAKALHTYREDVHRILTSLIDKGMVHPSLNSPTTYVAVALDTALESTLKKQESELREMEERKRELQELAKQHSFLSADEAPTFKFIKSVKELVAAALGLVASAKEEYIYVVPSEMLDIAERYSVGEEAKKVIEQGVSVRGISDISYADIAPAKEHLDRGEDLRHYDDYKGVFFVVVDQKHCLSAINVALKRISLHEPISLLWADDTKYAEYLTATFEMLWQQSVPAAQRLEELKKQGPPQA